MLFSEINSMFVCWKITLILFVLHLQRCMEFYNSGPWMLDDEGIEEQCRDGVGREATWLAATPAQGPCANPARGRTQGRPLDRPRDYHGWNILVITRFYCIFDDVFLL